jgi:hypothetical protein
MAWHDQYSVAWAVATDLPGAYTQQFVDTEALALAAAGGLLDVGATWVRVDRPIATGGGRITEWPSATLGS